MQDILFKPSPSQSRLCPQEMGLRASLGLNWANRGTHASPQVSGQSRLPLVLDVSVELYLMPQG